MEVLGYRIRQARKEAGLTVEELARRAEVGVRQLFRWEAGDSQPRVDNLVKIAEALGKSVDFFVVPQTTSAAEAVEKVAMHMARAGRRMQHQPDEVAS